MKNSLHMKSFFTSAAVFALLMFSALMLQAQTTIYVNSATGNDGTGNGTAGSPYKTFHKGYSMASSGSILDLTGTFTWTDADETGDAQYSGYTVNKTLTIQGQTGSETVIQAATTENTADRGVLSVRDATVTLKYLTIRYGKNTASSGYDLYGGGISCGYNTGSPSANTWLTLENCRIVNNISSNSSGFYRAGGISTMSSILTLRDSEISNNYTSLNFYGSGGVSITRDYGSLIENCSVTYNQGNDIGGADNSYASATGGVTLGNVASGNLRMMNVTIAYNTTNSYGGGLGAYPRWQKIFLTNVTIAENTSSGTVYGGMHIAETSGFTDIKNSLIANNKCSSGTPVDFYRKEGTVTDNGYNAVESTSNYTWGANTITTGFENVNLNSTLASNGSLNISKTLALSSGSIAIDAGDATAHGEVNIPTTDQRGMNRNSTVDIGAFEYGGTSGSATWTGAGASPNDWSASDNWTVGVPNSGYAVTIPNGCADYPIIKGDYNVSNPASCMNLTIADAASVTIDPGKALTVNGILTVNNDYGLYILADETGHGSLIHHTDDVMGVLEMYYTGSSNLAANQYHFVSIPVNMSNPTSDIFNGFYMYELNPTVQNAGNSNYYGVWDALGTSTTTPLSLNKGYMVYYPGDDTYNTFIELLNNGDFSYAVTGHAGTYTFNLVPNPYPSPVNWGESDGWTKSAGIGGTCYVWNASSGNYNNLVSSSDNFIPIGQAFMVAVYDETTPSLTINNAARTHSSQAFYKSGSEKENQLVINATSNNYADETVVKFSSEATEAFDLQIDGMKLSGLEEAPQLYTLSGNEKYSINSLPVFQDQKIVQMNFETQFTGEVTFDISGTNSFDQALNIYLMDDLTNQTINLRNQPVYTFNHNPGNAPDRFKLVFGGTIGIEETESQTGNLWISGNMVYINASELNGQQALVEVYNPAGQRILAKSLVLEDFTTFELSFGGFVIVKLTSGEKVLTAKGILMK